MTNEITTNYTNKKLNTYTTRIAKSFLNAKASMFKCAVLLKEVKETGVYKDDFKNIIEYAEHAFGIKKTTCYAMLKVAEEYTNEDYTCNLPHTTKENYALSQVTELLPLGYEKSVELSKNEVITPEMTQAEIRKIVNKIKKEEEQKNVIEAETVEETESNSANTETEVNDILNEISKLANDLVSITGKNSIIEITAEYINSIKEALETE